MRQHLKAKRLFAGGLISILLTFLLATVWIQSAGANVGACNVFPANNVWNMRVDNLPVHPNSANFISNMSPATTLHPDFGTVWDGAPNGIPYTTVTGNQANVPIIFDPNGYSGESDKGPFPIPTDAPVEGGPNGTGDRHVLVVDTGHCMLYELYNASPNSNGSWTVWSSAKWDLNSNALRPAGWTSADAAGLPMLPGLVRYDEATAGAINHALRFTVETTQKAYWWPARHYASSNTNTNKPPMGLRVRLKASVDITHYPGTTTLVSTANRAILTAMKEYGMFVADNGGDWYVSGAPNMSWDDSDLHNLNYYAGSDFEVVDESSWIVDPNSGQAGGATATPTKTETKTPTVPAGSTPTDAPTSAPTNTLTNTRTKTPTNTSTATKTPTATPIACSSAPVRPTLAAPRNGSTVTTRQVTLDWTDVNCATSYDVQIRQGSTTGTFVARPTSLTSSKYTTNPLTPGKTFYWRVRAKDAKGTSSWTGYWHFKVSPAATVSLQGQPVAGADIQWWFWPIPFGLAGPWIGRRRL